MHASCVLAPHPDESAVGMRAAGAGALYGLGLVGALVYGVLDKLSL